MSWQCTGTLVAPDLVLSAAHCVMDPWKRTPFPLKDIHFLAGVLGSENNGHATAKCLHFPKDYEFVPPTLPSKKVPIRAFFKDAVVIVLNEKLAVEPVPLAQGVVAEPGLRLVHAAYPKDRRFALTAQLGCHLLRADLEGPLWFNDCDTRPASSGGPLFTQLDSKLKLVAIMVGGTGQRHRQCSTPHFRMAGFGS